MFGNVFRCRAKYYLAQRTSVMIAEDGYIALLFLQFIKQRVAGGVCPQNPRLCIQTAAAGHALAGAQDFLRRCFQIRHFGVKSGVVGKFYYMSQNE